MCIRDSNTPLHDGAVVIQGNRVTAATCYLPLSDNMNISKDLGTRHRAAVGISEATDALTIVVSEETGRVSVAQGGKLEKIGSAEHLRSLLRATCLLYTSLSSKIWTPWSWRSKSASIPLER